MKKSRSNFVRSPLLLATTGLLLLAGSFGCKQRKDNVSESKYIFADDHTDGRDDAKSHRFYKVDPKKYPFIISMATSGCTGFILDRNLGIGMTAYHCSPKEGDHICFLAPRSLDDNKPAPGTNQTFQSLNGVEACPIEGVIAGHPGPDGKTGPGIIELMPLSTLDYVIFHFNILAPDEATRNAMKMRLAETKLLGDASYLASMKGSKAWVRLTGYPADKYADSNLTDAACHVRSDLETSDSEQKTFIPYWRCLVGAWDRNPSRYKEQNPVEYKEMRSCMSSVADGFKERFKHDCSVYGGNSGGPLYFEDSASKLPVVIGHPNTYMPAPSAVAKLEARRCDIEQYREKYLTPTGCADPVVGKFTGEGWDQRNREDESTLPRAVSMPMIVSNSKFLRANPRYIYSPEITDAQIRAAIDELSSPANVEFQGLFDELLEGKK